MQLSDIASRFVLHWGEMGSAWGVNRTVAQIHALLFFYGKPLPEEITETLGVARIRNEQQPQRAAKLEADRTTHVLGDRRDYFETSTDVWELHFAPATKERKQRGSLTTRCASAQIEHRPTLPTAPPTRKTALRETLHLTLSLGAWADEMLRLSPATLDKVLRMTQPYSLCAQGGCGYACVMRLYFFPSPDKREREPYRCFGQATRKNRRAKPCKPLCKCRTAAPIFCTL